MKISVVIPVYNAEKFILESVNSVLNQTYTNLEIICIDDCSTDNTFELLKSIEDKRFFLYQNEQNEGVIFTRSRAYSLCSGDFIANMDADDISSLDRLETQFRFLQENKGVDIVGSAIDIMKIDGVVYDKWTPPLKNDEIKSALLFEMAMPNPTVMFRAKLKTELKHELEFYSVEDYALYCVLATKGYRLANIEKTLLKYRIVDSGMTQSNEKKSKFRDDVHKLVYKSNFESLGMNGLDLDIHRLVVTGEIKNIFQLDELAKHLKLIVDITPSSYCSKYAIEIKVSQLWSYVCLRASNNLKLPIKVFFNSFKFDFNAFSMLVKAFIRSYMKSFGFIK